MNCAPTKRTWACRIQHQWKVPVRPIRTFTVRPALPAKLEPLRELAYNLRWSWDHDTIQLFRRLDSELWESCKHNPVRLLAKLQQEQLNAAAEDDAFLAQLERAYGRFKDYLETSRTWYRKTYPSVPEGRIAYFSAEYGLAECLPIYSGGLGILAGDHLKSSSDLGVPLIGVGLLYQEEYFHQRLNKDGWQTEEYIDNDFYTLPITPVRDAAGNPITISVDYPGRQVIAQVWRVDVGRVSLYLLDTNLNSNRPEDRLVTERLYRGDPDVRIRQEILLGIGGMRALNALELCPAVCHMNEGHSAFLGLERIRLLMRSNQVGFPEARELAKSGTIFTTHTPVPAGIDRFAPDLMERYFSSYYRELGLTRESFMALGRQNPTDAAEPFSMAILAIHLSGFRNGVSRLHGQVSRKMWQSLWPNAPLDEVPIDSITNGVHALTWISGHDIKGLYDIYLGPRWLEDPTDRKVWEGVMRFPDDELWRTHVRRREHLVSFARRKLQDQLRRQGSMPAEIERAGEALDPEALTIGFARRFATYKRATLIFRHPERLARILNNPKQPVQLIIAGKAHPEDNPGKELIHQIAQFAARPDLQGRVVFIEDYDMSVARHLVQGVDVWLNTPRRPLEASGTSGMKVALNGGLNMSVLDGWWDEAYDEKLGWAIGTGKEYADNEFQDELEVNALYDLLEKSVVPLFYDRGIDDVPNGWIAKVKASIRTLCPVFNTNRMVHEYAKRFYVPAIEKYERLGANGMERARALAAWKASIEQRWSGIRITRVNTNAQDGMAVGSQLEVEAQIDLSGLPPEDVAVEIYHGRIDASLDIAAGTAIPMTYRSSDGGPATFVGCIPCDSSGQYGYTVRVLPKHEDLGPVCDTGLVRWAE
ncbi:MAG: glycosyltransferase family 1 protein [Chloroflexota bacterium]|nr:MAG: glycosyltransferase family 1 protein [Chloroflexota bacterium]